MQVLRLVPQGPVVPGICPLVYLTPPSPCVIARSLLAVLEVEFALYVCNSILLARIWYSMSPPGGDRYES